MAGSDEPDDHRLAGRTPRPARTDPADDHPARDADLDEPADDDQLDAVTRLMGFLRSTD